MTWIGAALPVGDEVYFYYGGYARGHKVEPTTERQIGLARMKKDRYLALVPTGREGTIVTRPFLVPGGRLTVNARAPRGSVLVRVLDEMGRPFDGLGVSEAGPIQGDVLAGEERWPRPLGDLKGKPVRLEFQLRDAALFGFGFAT
jgi:hypothetical protein